MEPVDSAPVVGAVVGESLAGLVELAGAAPFDPGVAVGDDVDEERESVL